MEVDAFVEQLRACAPSVDGLVAEGLTHDEAEELRRGFYFVRNDANTVAANPLLDLLTRYDGTRVDIGSIRFCEPRAYSDNRWIIGKDESDPLILDLNTQRVYIEEAGANGYVLCECAESADKFLEALLPAAHFLGRCACDVGLYEDQEAAYLQARECAEKAGGTEFFNFYALLIGYEGDVQ